MSVDLVEFNIFFAILFILAILVGIGLVIGKTIALIAILTAILIGGILFVSIGHYLGFLFVMLKAKRYKVSAILVAIMVLIFAVPVLNNINLFGFTFNYFYSKCLLLLPFNLFILGMEKMAIGEKSDVKFAWSIPFIACSLVGVIIYYIISLPTSNLVSKIYVKVPDILTTMVEGDKYASLTHYDFLKDSLAIIRENGKEITRTNINEAIRELGYRKHVNIYCLKAELKDTGLYYIVMFKDKKYFSFDNDNLEQQYFYVNPDTFEIFDQDKNKIEENVTEGRE